ncbi:MAG: HAD-IIB family hydrolase [Erysipelotrichaceae bacterium]|nr:HAD-IIB family hydrolase [Erysipelotrichaceae bacterium]
MKKPKLMIADIDGTLMPKGENISPFTREILSRLHKAGIWVCIASGRPLEEVKMSLNTYRLDFVPEFIVGMNGGEIEDTLDGTVDVLHLMEPETIKAVVTAMKDQPCNITQYRENKKLYAVEYDELVEYSSQRAGKTPHIVKKLSEFWEKPNAKLMFRSDDPAVTDAVEAYANTLQIPGVRFFKTQPFLLEVCDEHVHKGAALEWICRKYGIDLQDVLACGDAANDNEMIEMAGTGLVLKGCLPSTLAIADEVTDETCENDGLPKWIDKHLGKYL